MAFQEYNELVEPLELPINGKTYEIPPITLDGGVKLAAELTPGTKLTDEEFYQITLGTALEEMRADQVKPSAISRAAFTSLADWRRDRATAEVVWKTGGYPKATAQATEEVTPEDSTSTSTGEASTTPRPASTSGTSRSRKTSSK